MIRRMKEADRDEISEIWLNSNQEAHGFIPAKYWKENYKAVKEMLLQAEVYTCETETAGKTELLGFIGLNGNYVEGIFVRKDARSQGVGRQLLDYVKNIRYQLRLNVYQKNLRAIRFYQREGFFILREDVDENTGEKDYTMLWERR